MTDVISLSELSDEPPGADEASQRLIVVLDRLPENRVRIANALYGRIRTLSDLQAKTAHDLLRLKNCGGKYIKNVKTALAHFGLTLAGEKPLVVRDGATIAEAQLQRLMDWIDQRMKAHVSLEERDVLRDAMRVLDGQAPTGQRWALTCEERGCERERGHRTPHRSRAWNVQTLSEEIHEWEPMDE